METFSALLAFCEWNSPVNSPHKGQWRGALMLSLICACISGWVNNREAGDLRRHRVHYDVTVMYRFSIMNIWSWRKDAVIHTGDLKCNILLIPYNWYIIQFLMMSYYRQFATDICGTWNLKPWVFDTTVSKWTASALKLGATGAKNLHMPWLLRSTNYLAKFETVFHNRYAQARENLYKP